GKTGSGRGVPASVWPMIADGRVRPIIGARLPIQQAGDAHRRLVASEVTGKIVLTV
ncbi:zinc-binding dehydrogenase, partial [Mycobacterium avium]|uniref:zinc-binding dehydrogenase n=1 Tax=Mycobacterium avium TaxID=1764 RepID=UPI00116011FF